MPRLHKPIAAILVVLCIHCLGILMYHLTVLHDLDVSIAFSADGGGGGDDVAILTV
jgi:hypothetical protein